MKTDIMKNKIWLILLIFTLSSGLLTAGNAKETSGDCVSYFTWEAVPGTSTSIQFNNESTGDFNTWMWDFGDGTSSGVFHPVHNFAEFGVYYVCLTISDGDSCYDVYCDTVEVVFDCQADFSYSLIPTTPILVQFNDLSTGFPDSWTWTFGDGTGSTEQHPTHAYSDPGSYDVCLTIFHNNANCTDSICKTIIIPDSVNCEASYVFDIDPYNPLELTFIDQSIGNITDWKWDFGDGTTSQEQNPVHLFPETGEYLVCLNVSNSDTLEYCFHFICKTLNLQDTLDCQSDFTAFADSSSNVQYRYYFNNQSAGNPDQWFWEFGDGNISHEQHPVHVYDDGGTYQVCLNVWNSNNPSCNDSWCKLLHTASYFQLGGQAFIGDYPINSPYSTGDTGIAILYRQRANMELIPVDTNVFHQYGYYWFSNMMEMQYVLKISLTPGSEHYQEFIPSYFPGSMLWEQAEILSLNENMFEKNTHLISVSGVEAGIGRISGRIISEQKQQNEIYRSFYDIPVILTSEDKIPLKWTSTDEYGQFEFSDIALGIYYLYADVSGIYSFPEMVMLNEEYSVNDTVYIKMYDHSTIGINDHGQDAVNIPALYPNPVSDKLNLLINTDRARMIQLNILNMTGQIIYSQEQPVSKGRNTIHIPAADMPAGIYIITLKWDGQSRPISKKFIKK